MRVKGLFQDFINDSTEFIVVYFSNTLVLLLFFYLLYKNADIIYPICLSVFIFSISIVLRWFKYKAFNQDVDMAATNVGYKIRCFTTEQRRVAKVIEKLNSTYGNEISNIKINDKEQRRLISQFIHSLKAPVTVIDIAVSNLYNASDEDNDNHDDTKAATLTDIKSENERITSTLDCLLSLLRLDEFEIDYSAEAINLEDSINNLINSMKRNFIYGRVAPKVQCNCLEPIVYTDGKWNKIMLEQFVSNAIKYSYVRFSGRKSETDSASIEGNMKSLFFIIDKVDGQVILRIKDQGIGIPEYDLDRITEPFFTGQNGRKVKNSSGIGLYITKRISEKLNHKVEIKSALDIGTEVKITYLSKL